MPFDLTSIVYQRLRGVFSRLFNTQQRLKATQLRNSLYAVGNRTGEKGDLLAKQMCQSTSLICFIEVLQRISHSKWFIN